MPWLAEGLIAEPTLEATDEVTEPIEEVRDPKLAVAEARTEPTLDVTEDGTEPALGVVEETTDPATLAPDETTEDASEEAEEARRVPDDSALETSADASEEAEEARRVPDDSALETSGDASDATGNDRSEVVRALLDVLDNVIEVRVPVPLEVRVPVPLELGADCLEEVSPTALWPAEKMDDTSEATEDLRGRSVGLARLDPDTELARLADELPTSEETMEPRMELPGTTGTLSGWLDVVVVEMRVPVILGEELAALPLALVPELMVPLS